MSVAERLRRLDDAVLPPTRPPAPWWVRLSWRAMGLWVLILYFAAHERSVGWLIIAIVYGSVELPALIGAAVWAYRWDRVGHKGSRLMLAVLPITIGVAIVVAAALAPPSGTRSRVHYARGCHPAPASVVAKIKHSIHGKFHVDRVAVFGSKDAAVASALVSGTLDIGGLKVPLVGQPADYALAPGPFAVNNDLARRVSPSLPTLFGGGGPIGGADDQVNDDRGAAENCVSAS